MADRVVYQRPPAQGRQRRVAGGVSAAWTTARESGMPESDSAAVEWIIANTINETAPVDLDALASHIVAALEGSGYCIVSRKSLVALLEDSALFSGG